MQRFTKVSRGVEVLDCISLHEFEQLHWPLFYVDADSFLPRSALVA